MPAMAPPLKTKSHLAFKCPTFPHTSHVLFRCGHWAFWWSPPQAKHPLPPALPPATGATTCMATDAPLLPTTTPPADWHMAFKCPTLPHKSHVLPKCGHCAFWWLPPQAKQPWLVMWLVLNPGVRTMGVGFIDAAAELHLDLRWPTFPQRSQVLCRLGQSFFWWSPPQAKQPFPKPLGTGAATTDLTGDSHMAFKCPTLPQRSHVLSKFGQFTFSWSPPQA
mmetsp:Transcript_56024/g.156091  ORF Transcript_56024/g.156091 Transcript_56024/m.156091 type:complete len:221 (+) Transcript_56024:284-946(+)